MFPLICTCQYPLRDALTRSMCSMRIGPSPKTCMHTVANPSPFSWVLCVCLGVAAVASLPWLAIPSKLSATLLVSWFSVRSRVNTKYLAFMPCERLPSEDAYD
jgi:hypothetical protein